MIKLLQPKLYDVTSRPRIVKNRTHYLLFGWYWLFDLRGGAFEGVEDQVSPFGYGRGEGVDAGHGDPDWICAKEKPRYDEIFRALGPADGKVTGSAAKTEMLKSKLPNSVLGKIWKLSDIDKDGMLDDEEFALAMHLIQVKIDGHELPAELPAHLVPPSKRN
ncbi:EH domain-containing protein 3 [Eumeta japonica]|uniref:EH domain-containing protein 3 n=1 Tax=Eumeta variegata TaxID=151549 RepID=A0A4C1Y5Q7_EUMVA|nr:EH domain-containing protein 3 [Eumeta japonica]